MNNDFFTEIVDDFPEYDIEMGKEILEVLRDNLIFELDDLNYIYYNMCEKLVIPSDQEFIFKDIKEYYKFYDKYTSEDLSDKYVDTWARTYKRIRSCIEYSEFLVKSIEVDINNEGFYDTFEKFIYLGLHYNRFLNNDLYFFRYEELDKNEEYFEVTDEEMKKEEYYFQNFN